MARTGFISAPTVQWKDSSVRKYLRIARQQAQLSREDVADESGYSAPQIKTWENGYHSPSVAQLLDWIESLGLELYVAHKRRNARPGQTERGQLLKEREAIP